MAVRSKRLGATTRTAGGTTTIYTVPSGHRTIIKGIFVRNTNAAAQRAILSIFNGATDVVDFTVWLGANGTATEEQWLNVFQVMNEGETLVVQNAQDSMVYAVSGAELLL